MRSVLALLLLAAAGGSCAVPGGAAWSDLHAYGFGAVYGAGFEASSDSITVEDGSGSGFDFEGGLELDRNTETVAYYGARFGFAPLEISISQFGYDGSSDGSVVGGTNFAGQPIAGQLDVAGEMDLTVSKLMLGLDLINLPVGRVGLLAGVDYVEFDRFDLVATEAVPGVSVGDVQTILEDENAPVPIVGVRADAALPLGLRVGGEISGLKFDFDDADLLYLDLDLAVRYEPTDHFEFMLGYRSIVMELEGDVDGTTLDMDLDVNGPYAGVAIYF
jgi:hypothetical protein